MLWFIDLCYILLYKENISILYLSLNDSYILIISFCTIKNKDNMEFCDVVKSKFDYRSHVKSF